MRHPELAVLSTVVAISVLVPFHSQWRSRNIATIVLIIGTCLVNVVFAINIFAWAGHVRDMAPVWCDFCKSDLLA